MAPQNLTAPWSLSDVVFVVEERRIHASRGILAVWSPVMEAMFSESDDELNAKNGSEIALPQMKFHHILELMKVLHPPNKEVDGGNVKLLLPLAKEFQIEALISKCERVLLVQPESIDNLALAEQYELPNLRHKTTYDAIHKISSKSLLKTESFNQLSDLKASIFKEKTLKLDAVVRKVKQVVVEKHHRGYDDSNRYTRDNQVFHSCTVSQPRRTTSWEADVIARAEDTTYMVDAIKKGMEKLTCFRSS